MKSILVFLRILIVGCLWGLVFTEGIRVIMLCNWHFDIFWPDHWRQFITTWKAGWVPRAPKEWAFILLIIVFFPMLITGWWTLCMVAWEDVIWNIIKFPYTLYMKFIKKSSLASITAGNNRYGVVKRKSYKLIRPAGINTLRVPISDYGSGTTSMPMSAIAGSSYAAANPTTPVANASAAPVKKKTDVAATIDHALFKFDDDDDDDFDLDIDSFEKADISKKKSDSGTKSRRSEPDDDFDDDEKYSRPTKKSKPKYDFDDDDFDDDDDEEEEAPRSNRRESKEKDSRKSSRKSEETSKRSTRSSRNAEAADGESGRRSRTTEKTAETPKSPVYEALAQKNYDIITNITVQNTLIDFIGVSENDICLCLVDKESGDWLADEEMFNGEEPLWFSESSHRVSPVCKLNNAKKKIESALDDAGFEQRVRPFVIIQMANIINADDMFDIWKDMGIEVTRINRGAPKEIKLFSKSLTEANERISKKEMEKLRNLLKSVK